MAASESLWSNISKAQSKLTEYLKRIYLRTPFTDSSKTLKTTEVTSNKVYYQNENKFSSLRKMKYIQFGTSHQ